MVAAHGRVRAGEPGVRIPQRSPRPERRWAQGRVCRWGAPWSKVGGQGVMEGVAPSPLPTLVCLREKDDNRASN